MALDIAPVASAAGSVSLLTNCDTGVNLTANVGDTILITYTGEPGDDSTPIPPWVQGYGRGSAADACNDGRIASRELWPHGGAAAGPAPRR
jgi:hypothetical protein